MSSMNPSCNKTYIISIAVSEYISFNNLTNAIPDAEKIITALEKDYDVIIYEKLHNISDGKSIKQTLGRLREITDPDDALLILYNGHGAMGKESDIAYWQLSSSFKNNENCWYKCSDLFDEIRKFNVKDVAIFANACYSGNLFSQDGIMANHHDKGGRRSRILFTSGIKEEKVEDDNPFASLIADALEKNKNNSQVSLRRIIDYTITNFKGEDFYSTPRDGYFREHEGGQFLLYSRNQEKAFWDKINKEPSIEGYELFLEKFPNGQFAEEVTSLKNKLIEENNAWLEMLKNILSQVNNFKSRDALSKQFEKKVKQIHQEIEKLRKNVSEKVDDYEEWLKIRKINNDSSISKSERINSLKYFVNEYPNNPYRKDADRYIKGLEEKEEDDKS